MRPNSGNAKRRANNQTTMKIAIFEDDHGFATRLETLIRHYTHHPTAINTGVAGEITNWINKTKEPVLYLLDIVACGVTVQQHH